MLNESWIRLGMALFLGLLIGIDRQLRNKPLGIKTSMVISVASCLLTIVSIQSVTKYAVLNQINMDPMRLAAQIVSGVGFLGAGVILRRNNDAITGLTTAAMVWAASALGIAAGAGFYIEALVAVFCIILSVNLFPLLVQFIGPRKLSDRDVSVRIVISRNEEMSELIGHIRSRHKVKHLKIKDFNDEKQQIEMMLSVSEKVDTPSIYYFIREERYVLEVEVENVSA